MAIKDNVKNALLSSGSLLSVPTNEPKRYATRQKRYFNDETTTFLSEYAKYSSDFFEAQAQGLDPDDMYSWRTVHIRLADVVKPSATLTHKFDESKVIIVAERDIDYVREGTKFVTGGSTWLMTNPANLSNGDGMGIVDHCNAIWNSYDYYGNIHTEPLVVKRLLMSANDSDYQMGVLVTKGYYTIICQYNEWTKQLDTNSRIILGSAAYRITGYADFHQEFTGDYSTIRLLSFNARYDEPNADIDDMENHIAGGKAFSWIVDADIKDTMKVGETAQMDARSTRNGALVQSTEEYPIEYTYESSDESVATVDAQGFITAAKSGETIITTKLVQNPLCVAIKPLLVEDVVTTPHIEFTSALPTAMSVLQTAEISAAYFVGGEEQTDVVTWEVGGTSSEAYKTEIDGNTLTLTCCSGSQTPLTVTVKCNGLEVSASITLIGI